MHALAFNHCDPAMGNLFATVGKDQATGAAPAGEPRIGLTHVLLRLK